MVAESLCVGLLLIAMPAGLPADQKTSDWRVVATEAASQTDRAEIEVTVSRLTSDGKQQLLLPVRVIVTDSGGAFVDGGGHGLYHDGRFYADGTFRVELVPGDTQFEIRSGPNYVPLTFSVSAEVGKRVKVAVNLYEWFNPMQLGWYAGDNHVHAQHDARADVTTNLKYLVLQARANGLNFVTEAGSNVSYEDLDHLDTDSFLLRYAGELRPGAFVGHFNTPGIRQAIPTERYKQLIHRPLPGQAIFEEVHRLGGVTIHTHPLAPPQLRHWMGATEILSDAVLGRCADLLDVDSEASQQLWFTVLNLGNRVGVSGSTDSALGRRRTSSPGDRRLYCKADRLDYREIVSAMRGGNTMATSGGPLFAFLEIDGQIPGSSVQIAAGKTVRAAINIHCLHPLRKVQLYHRGNLVEEFDVDGTSGAVSIDWQSPPDWEPTGWFVVRAEDTQRDWAVTGPVFVESETAASPTSTMALLEISNHERFIHLRREFFAHLIVTVSPDQVLTRVELMRNDEVVKQFKASDASQLHEQRIPVTQLPGTYGPGAIWLTQREQHVHLQADWPVNQTGWYAVRAVTAGGTFSSDALFFDADNANSQAVSTANLASQELEFALHGYGEELPLSEIDGATEGDRWWYPSNTYWALETRFAGKSNRFGSPETDDGAKLFRREEKETAR